jgi:hypothetical protein
MGIAEKMIHLPGMIAFVNGVPWELINDFFIGQNNA